MFGRLLPYAPARACVCVTMTDVKAVYSAFDAGKFQDDDTVDKSRKQIYGDLIGLLGTSETLKTVDPSEVFKRLELTGPGNAGNAMTQHIKWACKYHRGRGVHVTPTVHVNGLEAGIVSSGAAAGLEPTRVCARSPLAVCSRR